MADSRSSSWTTTIDPCIGLSLHTNNTCIVSQSVSMNRNTSYEPVSAFADETDDDPQDNNIAAAAAAAAAVPPPPPHNTLEEDHLDGGGSQGDDDDDDDDQDDDDDDELGISAVARLSSLSSTGGGGGGMKPIHISSEAEHYENAGVSVLFTWSNPWLPSVAITTCLVVPVLLGNIVVFYGLFWKLWPTTWFQFHLVASLVVARYQLCSMEVLERKHVCLVLNAALVLEVILFAVLYPRLWQFLVSTFFTDVDGTSVIEWIYYKKALQFFTIMGWGIAVLRMALFVAIFQAQCRGKLVNFLLAWRTTTASRDKTARLRNSMKTILSFGIAVTGCILLWSIYSMMLHIVPWSPPPAAYNCDPLDETECAFPFPSFHHMQKDLTTQTGWRVHLQSQTLPPAKGGIVVDTTILNELDGFSTMAPLLFYIEGLKEAHEAGIHQLQGLSNIAESITPQSVTLLVEVLEEKLVPHSAEIDYIDPNRPSVMVFPAQPLKHNTHYALAVVNAIGADGHRLHPTRGMQRLLKMDENGSSSSTDPRRRSRYLNVLIPALETAASWFSYTPDPDSLQLLFDFQTVSEKAQLGKVRAVRDGVLAHLEGDFSSSSSSSEHWSWEDHVRTLWVDDHDECKSSSSLDARTVAAELDVPWFLDGFGPGYRAALLDENAVDTGRTNRLGVVKFYVIIPCSVRAAALGMKRGKPLRAVMEYGHGLFNTRYDVFDTYLHEMANDEGYVIVAMDWRGMSLFDLFTLAKVLLSKPDILAATRDNMIQGFASKFALQHFVRNGMMTLDWFNFKKDSVPTLEGEPPVQVFYGISQGGILGAGYSALSGVTGLIDRSILGVPGTSFALILTRTFDLQLFEPGIFLLFYTGRHIRIFLCLLQMGWDSVEGAGVLG